MSEKRDVTDPQADLAQPEHFDDADSISCRECLKEVPRSEAQSVEGSDYVWYFCGLECYERWQRKGSG